jgi:glycosyltransferase involved in cell wall biosynthesis
MAEMYPDADIFTLFKDEGALPDKLKNRNIVASKWNWLPGKYLYYRHLLPAYPRAFEALDLRGYDLVLSSDSCLAKGVLVDDEATHVCFCHSPMRCLYDQYRECLESLSALGRSVFKYAAHHLRMWDYTAAQRVTGIATNSQYIAKRVRSYYGLDSQVTYAPVHTAKGYIDSKIEDYYLCVGRLVDTKRVDLAIQACNRLGKRLIIVGKGREQAKLKRIAGPTIEFADWVSSEQLATLYARCKALLFPSREDFGLVPLECQSYGRPVIAYGRGGALETVISGVTGRHFDQQTPESLVNAILRFEEEQDLYDPLRIRANACSFDTSVFKNRLSSFVDLCVEAKRAGRRWTEIAEVHSLESLGHVAQSSSRTYLPSLTAADTDLLDDGVLVPASAGS